MNTDSKSSNITIHTHSMKWVKSHCKWHHCSDNDYYTYNKARKYDLLLWAPHMSEECCGKTFTVVSYNNIAVNVKEVDYSIPIWLLKKASRRRLLNDTNIS